MSDPYTNTNGVLGGGPTSTGESSGVSKAKTRLRKSAEVVAELAADAGAVLKERSAGVAARTSELYGKGKTLAVKSGHQADELIHERPYAALAAGVALGFLIGHLISARHSQVIYLRDARRE